MYLLTIPTRSRLFGLNSLIIPSRNAIFLGSSPIAFCRRRILNTSQPDVILSRWPPGMSSPQTCTRLSRFLWSSSPLRLFRSILKGLIETMIEFSATVLSIFKRFMLCNCVNLTSAFLKAEIYVYPLRPPREQNILPYLNLLRILSRHVAKTLSLLCDVQYFTYLTRSLPQSHVRKGNPPNYTVIKRRVTSHSTVILINRTFVVVFLPTQTKDNFSPWDETLRKRLLLTVPK